MKNKQQLGFIWLPVVIGVAILGLLGAIVLTPTIDPVPSDANIGTAAGANTSYTKHLLPTADATWDVGTSTNAYRNVFVGNLTVSGTCTGCSGASTADLQDAYNNAGVDAQITSADAKELIYFISDTTDPAEFIISTAEQGGLQLAVGSTTNGSWFGYGALGIGTTTPGAGLGIAATSTILSGRLHVDDHLKVSYIIATSTQNNSFGGALDVTEAATSTFTGGISASTGGLLTTTGLTITGGDIQSSGKITVTAASTAATSTLPGFSATSINTTGLNVGGALRVDTTGTSTFAGGLSLGAGGLNISAGGLTLASNLDALIGGKLTVLSTATSSFTGGLNAAPLNITSGTSTFANGLQITGGCFRVGDNCLEVSAGGAGGTPGGTDEQVQFNDSSSFGGAAALLYDNETDRVNIGTATSTPAQELTVVGDVYITGTTTVSEIKFRDDIDYDIASSTPNRNTLYSQNIIKAWVHVHASAIQDHFNIASVGVAGNAITITIDQDFANEGYAVVCNGWRDGDSATFCMSNPGIGTASANKTNGAVDVNFLNDAGGNATPDSYDIIMIGRQ